MTILVMCNVYVFIICHIFAIAIAILKNYKNNKTRKNKKTEILKKTKKILKTKKIVKKSLYLSFFAYNYCFICTDRFKSEMGFLTVVDGKSSNFI